MVINKIEISEELISAFCRRNHIIRFAFFESLLSEDFRPESDIDVLVEFDPEHIPGLFRLARMENELSSLLNGRKVDIRTIQDLSSYFRDEVVASSEVVYAEK